MDRWLEYQEHEYRGWNEPEFKCKHCDKPIHKLGYCSDDCFHADML